MQAWPLASPWPQQCRLHLERYCHSSATPRCCAAPDSHGPRLTLLLPTSDLANTGAVQNGAFLSNALSFSAGIMLFVSLVEIYGKAYDGFAYNPRVEFAGFVLHELSGTRLL